MRSLKGRFALLVGSAAILVILAAGSLFWALQAVEGTMERTLAAQQRLDLLAELSGRLADYGLAVVEAAGTEPRSTARIDAARAEVDRALRNVDGRLGSTVASVENLLGRTEFAARSRPLARLQAALALLDRQVEQALRQPDPAARNDAIRGALNAFGAITGPSLSFMVDAERRGIELATAEAKSLTATLRIGGVAAALAALVAVLLMHRAITRPLLARLAAVQKAAAAIGQGKLDLHLPVSRRDELGLVVASFNRMAARLRRREIRVAADRAALEETVRQRTADVVAANERLAAVDRTRRRFFADVSHELRTPLTVILGECDVGLRTLPPEAEGVRGALATIRKRAQRLQRRVEDLLRLARSESGQLELALRPVSVSSVLAEAVEGLAAEARRRGIALAFHPGASDADLLADPEWLRQVVEGLVDNAFRHAAGATRVVVSLDATPDGAEIAVTDDGPGFPAGGDTLFERFSRAPERTGAPGFGIGLALARWIVEQHGGQIALGEPSRGRGARVVIRLPAERREAVA
jgi:signal transduction histidine kinase